MRNGERQRAAAGRSVSFVQKRFGFRQTNAPVSNFQEFCRPIRRRVAPQSTAGQGFRARSARPSGWRRPASGGCASTTRRGRPCRRSWKRSRPSTRSGGRFASRSQRARIKIHRILAAGRRRNPRTTRRRCS